MEWISVKDRLPEFTLDHPRRKFTDTVLGTNGEKLYIGYFRFSKNTEILDFACLDTDDLPTGDDFAEYINDIQYWMPLPEPPKED